MNGRSITVVLGIICMVLVASLVGAIANYTSVINEKDDAIASLNSQITEKDATISSLNSQISSLNSQINRLQVWLDSNKTLLTQIQTWLQENITYYNSQITILENQNNQLQMQISSLETQITALNNQLQQLEEWLDGNRTLLSQTQAWLQANVTYYESQITYLQNEITALQNEVDSLNAQLTALEEEYEAYVSAYQSLREKVNQRWYQINVEPFITPNDQAVRNIVYSVTGGWSNPSDWNEYWQDIKAMYDWVVDNVEYRSDGLYPMLPYTPSGDLDFRMDMWQFPNETLSLRKGDCEDMAILLCSMIRCYCDMKYQAECILIVSSTSAHVGVQLPVSGYKLVILDPAGRYYSHDAWGNIAFNDITTEINNWLDNWKPTMGSDVYVRRVFSDYLDEKFTSTSEYISWMYSR